MRVDKHLTFVYKRLKVLTNEKCVYNLVGNHKNQMIRLITLLLSLALLSCKQPSSNRNESIKKFENILGEQEVFYLNEIIKSLDTYLDQNYSNQDFKFKSFLIDVQESKLENY